MQLIDGKRESVVTHFGIYGFFGKYRFLSNMWPAQIILDDGLCYPSAEHAYIARKTLDIGIRTEVSKMPKALKAYSTELENSPQGRPDWKLVRDDEMQLIHRAKFMQNRSLGQDLLDTGLLYLEESNNWGDVYWGRCNGKGLNKCGLSIMNVRNFMQEHPGVAEHPNLALF